MTVAQLKYPMRVSRVYDKLYLYYITSVLLLMLSSFHFVNGERCNFDVDPCICTTSSFQLNLKSFMEARKGVDLQANGENKTFTYFVQPCNRKLSHSDCEKVNPLLVSCQINVASQDVYGLGLLNMYDATEDQDNFILTNSFTTLGVNRILHLTVKCSDHEEQFTYDGNSGTQSPITYKFTLGTRHVCAQASENRGLSPGSVMVIIFFVLLIVYILGGFLFQKFVRKAQGLEMVPNYVFWKDLPCLIKDGIVFTFQCCKGSSGYDKI